MSAVWEQEAQDKFRKLLDKVPVFMRGIAEEKVSKKAESLAREDNRNRVSEKDMVEAFFAETPFGFHGLMKSDMDAVGVDYRNFGY